MNKVNFALIGAGGIGKIWKEGAGKSDLVSLKVIVDTDIEKAKVLAEGIPDCKALDSISSLLEMPEIEGVIVATPHKWLAPISKQVLEAGKHVLVEKPAGVSSGEVEENVAIAKEKNLIYMIGFNHRYHAAFLKAKQALGEGKIGEVQFIRARHGFGGRPGYEKEWRFQKEVSGGGELIDQGMHMVDLARYFMGDFVDIRGFAENLYWGGEVEDNGFLLLRTIKKTVASIHVSWTNWEWIHSFEIYGKAGYINIDGLDQRYRGPEKITIGTVDPQSGKFPQEEVLVFSEEKKEDSFMRELEACAKAIRGEAEDIPRGESAVAVLKIVESIYEGKG